VDENQEAFSAVFVKKEGEGNEKNKSFDHSHNQRVSSADISSQTDI